MKSNNEPCGQGDCGDPATFRFTWPGKREAFACTHHAEQLKILADRQMGFELQMIPLLNSSPPL